MLYKTGLALAALVLIVGQTGFAADEVSADFPAELPPTIAMARFENGSLTLTERRLRPVVETATVQVPVQRVINGQRVTTYVVEPRQRIRQVEVKVSRVLKQADYFLYDVSGQKILEADLAIVLKTSRVVLVSADGLPIAPFYRPLFRRDTLVVVPKQSLKPGGPLPVPTSKTTGFRVPLKPAPKATLKAAAKPPEGR